MAQQNPNKPMSTAGAYEDQKNNGNRKIDDSEENIGGAEKGGAGLKRAQSRMPPDADHKPVHPKSKED